MLLRGKSKEGSGKASPPNPSPAYMDSKQFAAYLASLRENRVNRPGTTSPQSTAPAISSRRESDRFSAGRPTSTVYSEASATTIPQAASSIAAKDRSTRPSIAPSVSSRYSTAIGGRDYYPEKPSAATPLKPNEVVPSATYIERGSRWMEKEEAFSLRAAMEDMDLQQRGRSGSPQQSEQGSGNSSPVDEAEARLYNAALDEAAELVWQHQHGVKPPEPGTPYHYKPHMRKDSYAHARTASIGRYGSDIRPSGLARDGSRSGSGSGSGSGSSSGSDGRSSLESSRPSMEGRRRTSDESTKQKSYGNMGSGKRTPSGGRRRSSMKRNITGEIEKPFSGDQIWEEPEGDSTRGNTPKAAPPSTQQPDRASRDTLPLRLALRNPLNKVHTGSGSTSPDSDARNSSPVNASPTKSLQKVEIYRNPPTQTRNPNYTVNTQKPAGPRESDKIPKKNGVEIRSDDIRQATSFKLGDRSAKLPTPSAVSDRPGRPIVSFDSNWKAPEEAAADHKPERKEPRRFTVGSLPEPGQGESQKDYQPEPQKSQQKASPLPPVPSHSFTPPAVSASTPSSTSRPSTSSYPSVPSISIGGPESRASPPVNMPIIVTPDDSPTLPTINVSTEDDRTPNVPIIVTPDDNKPSAGSSSRPSARPLPTPSKVRNAGRSHWSPAPGSVSNRATAVCHECRFPIEGRFVALHGGRERFHPQCFSCYACGTGLEALEISPEPDEFRDARLDRIARRAAGEVLPEEPGQTMAEDGDHRLRFYCHLDWHELFAPRCKHCKTPILGEHIVALGAHWHYGHFFCAECGDPFEHGMTHIERTATPGASTARPSAPSCKRCKVAVIGQYVQALGGEWHDECFRCGTCGGGFADGQIFPAGDRILCKTCRMRELKA
ncbi:LIM domain-containing protein C4F6.12 [Apiospora hydei]|uniref:LIM domain-containing protein C4F6.12 n=1 Tax=Apiospora hydei TaxID=1337664 RepID=A0ABR1WYL3_9PEZI